MLAQAGADLGAPHAIVHCLYLMDREEELQMN
jgi:hypothetical protein